MKSMYMEEINESEDEQVIHTMVIIDLLIVEDEQVNILVYRRERQEKVICVLAVFCNGC